MDKIDKIDKIDKMVELIILGNPETLWHGSDEFVIDPDLNTQYLCLILVLVSEILINVEYVNLKCYTKMR